MRKVISILLVLVICLSMAVTAFANDDFVKSPGESGTPCEHKQTNVTGKKDPTCTTAGHTGKTVCSECGEVLNEGSAIPALGHKFNAEGVCTVCGANDVPKTGDNSNMFLWVSMMVVSAVALASVVGLRRKAV